MTKLTDLSEQALADLLDLPLDKARKWLEVAKSISDEEDSPYLKDVFNLFGDFESATSLLRSSVKKLMGLSVEEVEQLQTTGEFYKLYPYFKRKVPKDAETRLRYLRELLNDEVEFEARYPAAYEVLFEKSEAINGLLLPSFGVRVLRCAPSQTILSAGWHQEWKRSQDSGDAFSLTFERRALEETKVDQTLAPLDLGYMRGVLLAVLSREEYAERIATELHFDGIREELEAPARSSVRITDLRLATSHELGKPNSLKKALLPLLKLLEPPITLNSVPQWKWDLLWEAEEVRGQESDAAEVRS
jgi:hypothetical protein